jgi:probable F420-dependent oxidoreductase
VKFGIAFANTGPFVEPEAAAAFAEAAEDNGFESLWTVEHVVVPSGYESTYPYSATGKMPGREDSPIPDPLIWLAYVAAATDRIRLATGILILPQRNPVVLAKELATLDHLSRGRMILGIGIGWLAEEFDAIGVPFAERAARTDDNVAALRALWSDEPSHHSEFTRFANCIVRPRPAGGSIPIHVGGHSPAAARRAGRLGDGYYPIARGSTGELADLFAIARSTAARAGRDPDAIEMSTGGAAATGSIGRDEIRALADIGTDRILVPSFSFWRDPAGELARYADTIISPSQP